jgi:hypothetical protein
MTDTLLERFVHSFQKAIRAEMEAMRSRLGPFEVPLASALQPEDIESTPSSDAEDSRFLYSFTLSLPSDKVVTGIECSLRGEREEHLVTVLQVGAQEVLLSCPEKLLFPTDSFTLVIYPWFLYEKLLLCLDDLAQNRSSYCIESALALFGKRTSSLREGSPLLPHSGLNSSQKKAVELCCRSDLAFVWGPPGTGKTRTLGHIAAELLHQGLRVLVTSTTNAAVDQALEQLATLEPARPFFGEAQIVRLGLATGETYGTSLREVVDARDARRRHRLQSLEQRRLMLRDQLRMGQELLQKLEEIAPVDQLTLFGTPPGPSPGLARTARRLFSAVFTSLLISLEPPAQRSLVGRRLDRLERLSALCAAQIETLRKELRQREFQAIQEARLVLATMTNVYLSRLLSEERFDVVMVEEAGMAILPTLFYCASLARQKVIAVGDPRQLPPIVQSSAPYVHRAMGRDIFSITVPRPLESNLVALLDVQYRMHPAIGDLVSRLFYQGHLRNGVSAEERQAISDRSPFPSSPLVVVDTRGETTCQTRGKTSRGNEKSAHFCAQLALLAHRDGLQSIGIITPYVEQARLIRQFLSATQANSGIECSTVHRFQGHERDLILFDTADASPLPPGVLLTSSDWNSAAANLLNVSISRARGKLIIVGDISYFRERSPGGLINALIDAALEEGQQASIDLTMAGR